MKMAPDNVMKGPRGVNCKDFFDMMDVCLGISLNYSQMATYAETRTRKLNNVTKTGERTVDRRGNVNANFSDTHRPTIRISSML